MKPTALSRLGQHPIAERPGVREAKAVAKAVRDATHTATWKQRVLPDLVLVGAQRSGTTALTDALFRLPMVARPRRGKGSHFFSYNHVKGWPWFQGQFPTRAAAARLERRTGHPLVTFDACPYYLFHPLALERLAEALPDVKVLVMLRDPVRRAESHYHHSVAHDHETLPFADALDAEADRLSGEVEQMMADPSYWSHSHEHHSYVAKGRYVDQIERLLELFPPEQVMIRSAEEFYADSDTVLAQLTEWIGVPRVHLSTSDNRNSHRYEPMTDALQRRLVETFAEPNEALFEMVGRRFDWRSP